MHQSAATPLTHYRVVELRLPPAADCNYKRAYRRRAQLQHWLAVADNFGISYADMQLSPDADNAARLISMLRTRVSAVRLVLKRARAGERRRALHSPAQPCTTLPAGRVRQPMPDSITLSLVTVAAVYIPPPSEIGRPAYVYFYRKRHQLAAALRRADFLGISYSDLRIVGYSLFAELRAEVRRRISAA